MTHRQFCRGQFSQFEIQPIQPEIYRQFSQFYKRLDSKEKNGIGVISRSKVAGGLFLPSVGKLAGPSLCWQARNTLARPRRSLLLAELSLAELSAYFWLNCLNFKSAELSLAELSGRD